MLYQCNTNMGKASLNQGKYSSWQIDNLHVARVIKVNNKITELRTILQRESQNS